MTARGGRIIDAEGETGLRLTTEVPLPGRTYPVVTTWGRPGDLGRTLLARFGKRPLVGISDPRVRGLWAQRVDTSLEAAGLAPAVWLEAAEGEGAKTLAEVERLAEGLVARGITRGTPLLALGGGAIGDVTGLLAALYHRGGPWAALPTTLLAQVDSSVGGKTAVNLGRVKNALGVFWQPALVWADVGWLATLPPREWRAGLAEVLKIAAVAEPSLAEAACALRGPEDGPETARVVARSVALKATLVAADERDDGPRGTLNFGHTLGHALERLDGGLLHGEAVAIGMAFAADLGLALGVTPAAVVAWLEDLLRRVGLPRRPPPVDPAHLWACLRADKKATGGALRFVLLTAPGQAVLRPVSDTEVGRALARFGVGRPADP